MEYVILEKFELATYFEDEKTFRGGSFRAEVFLNNPPSKEVKEEILSILDRFDHATLVSLFSENVEFIKKESDRFITVNKKVTDSTVAEVILAEVNDFLVKSKSDLNCFKVITSIDFDDKKIIETEKKDLKVFFSEGVFNS